MSLEAAMVRLLEAVGKHRAIRDRQPIEAALAASVGKVFRAQARAMKAALAGKLREAAGDGDPAIFEDLTDQIMAAWAATDKATEPQLTRALVIGINAAHGAGQEAVAGDDLAGHGAGDGGGDRPASPLAAEPTPVGPSVGLSFTARDPRVASYLEESVGELISGISDATRDRIGELIKQGVANGESPRAIAGAVTDEFEEMGAARPQAHTTTRAHLIAATEVSNAYARGKLDGARAMAGPGSAIEKSWLSVGAGNCCGDCTENQEAGWIDEAEVFPSGDDCPTAHPGCRCTLLVRSARISRAASTDDSDDSEE